jgi:Domain of unknown function (DUF4136)
MHSHQATRSFRLWACLAFLSLAITLGWAAKIKSDVDKSADFTAYKTFAWGHNLNPPQADAQIVLVGAVEEQLRARGLQPADKDHADLIVRYEAAGNTDMNIGGITDPTYDTTGGVPPPTATPWTIGFDAPSNGRYIRKGTLVIDIFDAHQHKLIWSASAAGSIAQSNGKAVKEVNGIVASMFNRYPVKPRA